MGDDTIARLEGEILSIQEDLARDLDVLTEHVPRPVDLVRVGIAVVGLTVGGLMALSWLARRRGRVRGDRRLRRIVREAIEEAS